MAVGGYDYNFVDTDLSEEFYCLICTFVPRQPHQVTCCGKIYCKGCLDELKRKNSNFNCPNCREKIANNYFKDINTERKIRQLKIYCTNKDSGCSYKVELKDLDSHLTQCLYQLVKCPNQCDVPSIQRQLLQHHLEEDCPNREVSCPHCNITDKHNIVTGSHLEECPDLLIPCPNEGCQEHVKRRELANHKQNCIKEVVFCPYVGVGCKQIMKREELDDHDKLSVRQHLEMAVGTLEKLCLNSNGILNIKMEEFKKHKDSDIRWRSPGFYTSPEGYKMSLSVYCNGFDDGKSKGTHVSTFICLMHGEHDDTLEWPFQGEVTVELLNQLEDKNHVKYVVMFNESTILECKQRVVGKQYGVEWGYDKFISHSELSSLNTQYLKDDTLYFRVTMTVTTKTKPWLARKLEMPVSMLKVLEMAVSTLKELEIAFRPNNSNGIVNLKMKDFKHAKENKIFWYSPGFYTTHGSYKMCLRVNANGEGDGKGTHVSCYVCLMAGEYDDTLEWPFKGEVTVELLNQLEDKNHMKSTLKFNESTSLEPRQRVVGKQYGLGWGYSKFISHSELSLNSFLNRQYLKDDTLYFRVSITVTSKTKPWLVSI